LPRHRIRPYQTQKIRHARLRGGGVERHDRGVGRVEALRWTAAK